MSLYLVTGGCGFIGSHLCYALHEKGHTVRVLDNLSTGSLNNLPPATELLFGSVTNQELVGEAMKGVVGCFHLAAIASVEQSMLDWVGTHHTNQSGTITVFDQAARANARPVPVVYASSAAVYGNCNQLPIREDLPLQPRSPYGADKYGCELHAHIAAEGFGVPNVGLRFFNVYGPRQQPGSAYSGVISIFCDRLLRQKPIEIFGDGQQTRDFIFVSDVAAVLLASMEHVDECPGVFNVCTGAGTSLLELASVLGELCGRKPEIRFRPPRAGEVAHSRGDPTLLRDRLGITDFVQLRNGLSETLEWMRKLKPDPARSEVG